MRYCVGEGDILGRLCERLLERGEIYLGCCVRDYVGEGGKIYLGGCVRYCVGEGGI